MYQEFLTSAKRYRMYWARNYIGWPTFSAFQPNETHRTLANWETTGKVSLIHRPQLTSRRNDSFSSQIFWHVTQNVDSLLTKAGCELLSELHGCSSRVVCIDCGLKGLTREQLQQIIRKDNPEWMAQSSTINPDADMYLSEEQLGDFKVDSSRSMVTICLDLIVSASSMSSMFWQSETRRGVLRR